MPTPRPRPHVARPTGYDASRLDPLERVLSIEGARADAVLAVVVDMIERARPDWHARAACRDPEHADLDFTTRSKPMQSRCIQVCGSCSERTRCLEWAIEIGDETAILGGMTPAARRAHGRAAARRARKRAKS